ncbi:MAG: hypothetical protein LH473_09670 [Chitinophagales bacterium]|nr:hypothetical protein [Chitinophagales bacterium]
MKRHLLSLTFSLLLINCSINFSSAQCAMCKASAESSIKDGNKTAAGLNKGIMYLLFMPYLLVGGLGYYWYVSNKKKQQLEEAAEGV